MAKRILEEINEFLEYLAIADEDSRKEENLKKKFGEEKYKAIYDLIGGKYTRALPKKGQSIRYLILYINDNGLRFLEEHQIKIQQEKATKTMLFLTSMIVLTTIANFFNELNLTNKWILMVIYAIFSVLILIYFKKAKVITI